MPTIKHRRRTSGFVRCIHLNQKRLLCLIGVWCLMFGHSLPPVHSGGIISLGGSAAVCETVVMDSSMLRHTDP